MRAVDMAASWGPCFGPRAILQARCPVCDCVCTVYVHALTGARWAEGRHDRDAGCGGYGETPADRGESSADILCRHLNNAELSADIAANECHTCGVVYGHRPACPEGPWE